MKPVILFFLCLVFLSLAYADPQPGEVFREYIWWKTHGDAGGALRVGGREGTTNWNTKIVNGYRETVWIDHGHDTDLEHSIKAEVNLEKILCHDGTRGLSFQINDSVWIVVPEADNIPTLKQQYQHHIYPNVEIPLDILNQGTNNKFKIGVSAEHGCNWPQNMIYGFHIRVYYDPANKPHPIGAFIRIQDSEVLGKSVSLELEASSANGRVGAYGGCQGWANRTGRFRSLGDGQVDFKHVFTLLREADYRGWTFWEWQCCVKSPEQGAPFFAEHIVETTAVAFDDFAGGEYDQEINRKNLALP